MQVPDTIIRLLARYSEGVRLTAEHGVRSGLVLEYACRNQPQGSGSLGRWIDRRFLHLRAWDGIRQRVQTTKELAMELVARRRAAGQTTMILDVASGTGRYLRDLVREDAGEDLIVACHDRNPREVMLGRRLIKQEGLTRISFSVGDATDHSSYLTNRDPDIVLAIGLFAILQRDDDVRSVMRLAFAHLSRGGCFVCSTLAKSHALGGSLDADAFSGQPAVRPPEAIAQWLRATGFVNIDQRFSQPYGFALIGWKPDDGRRE